MDVSTKDANYWNKPDPRHVDTNRYEPNVNHDQWRFLLPVPPDSTVLEIGANRGALSFQLARAYGQVVSVALLPECLDFIRNNRHQADQIQIAPLQGNALDLPFAPASFDLIVMNGVLERLGNATSRRKAHNMQLGTLKQIRQLLKPEGYLYLGVDNKIGLSKHFKKQPYTNVRHPLLSKRRRLAYTYRGYQQILKGAGFQSPTIYVTLWGYDKPDYLVNINDSRSFKYLLQTFLQPRRKVTRLFHWLAVKSYFLNLSKYFAPAFCIFAQR